MENDPLRVPIGEGAPAELGGMLDEHRDRLKRLVAFRMDRRLAQRVDASDVIQETFAEASRRYPEFLRHDNMPFFVWLRLLTQQRLATLHRHHLARAARDAHRETPLDADVSNTSTALADRLVDRHTDPGDAAAREEIRERLRLALGTMDPVDREVLALRHFEELTNAETASVLGLQTSAASKRYVRALERLRELMTEFF